MHLRAGLLIARRVTFAVIVTAVLAVSWGTVSATPVVPAPRGTNTLSNPNFTLGFTLSGGVGVGWGQGWADPAPEVAYVASSSFGAWWSYNGGSPTSGTFEGHAEARSLAWGDYDNDGRLDIISVCGQPPFNVRLAHNVGVPGASSSTKLRP